MDDSIRFAGQAGLTSLHHYQDFQPHLHTNRVTDILQNHRIYCSNPADFNDPWDCKPYFDPALLDDPVNHSATAESLIATHIPGPNDDVIIRQLRTNPAFLKKAMHEFSERQAKFITTRWGVYCLSPDPCLTLMWSHYSRNHRGICLEFAVNSSKFVAAQKVHYQKQYPALLLHEPESYLTMLLIKSDVWAYEQEFRLICPRFTDVEQHPLIMDGDYLSIGPRDLKSIIVGCQASHESVQTIRDLVKRYAQNVAVRYARRAANKYRLVIED
jgi:hypothetical protein